MSWANNLSNPLVRPRERWSCHRWYQSLGLNGLGRVSITKIFVSFFNIERNARQEGLSVFEF